MQAIKNKMTKEERGLLKQYNLNFKFSWMGNKRKNRYEDKINFIIEKIESIPKTNFDECRN